MSLLFEKTPNCEVSNHKGNANITELRVLYCFELTVLRLFIIMLRRIKRKSSKNDGFEITRFWCVGHVHNFTTSHQITYM